MPSGFVCDKCGQFFQGYARNVVYAERLKHDLERYKAYVFCHDCERHLIRFAESICDKPELSV